MKYQKLDMKYSSRGFSVIEVILAAAIFMLFASAAVVVVLHGFNTNRLGAEETIANQFATEGIEAVKSIKNQAYSNLNTVNPTPRAVIRNASNIWAFNTTDGSSNTLTHNVSDNYIRQVKVESVNRDASGNIVSTGGTTDPDTKKITSTVSWNFNSARPESVALTTYLSDWRKPIVSRGGILVYRDSAPAADTIKYKILDPTSGVWGTETQTADIDPFTTTKVLRAARLYASSTRNEKILISRHYDDTSQYIYAQVFNGTTWGNVNLLASWAATTFLDVRNFDGTYLNNGDFIVVYSDNTTTPKFKTWNGSIWSTPSGVTGTATQNIGGIPNYIVLRNRSGTNEVMAAFFDQVNDTNTQYFYIGNNNTYETADWILHTQHSAAAPTNTKEHIDFAWSPQDPPLKGALVYPSSGSDNTQNAKIWTANGTGGGSWSATSDGPNTGGRIGAVDIDGRKGVEEFVSCQKNANNKIICFKLTTTPSWTTPANNTLTNNTDSGIQRSYNISFEATSGNQALAVYSDNTSTAKFRKYDTSAPAFDSSASPISPDLGGVLKTVRLRSLTDNDDIMVLMADANNDLYSVVWDGSTNAMYTTPTGKAFSTHGTNGSAATNFWFDFAWDKF